MFWLAGSLSRTDMGNAVRIPPALVYEQRELSAGYSEESSLVHVPVIREIRGAGPVQLGALHARGKGGPSAMYGIAVKSLGTTFPNEN